MFWGDFLNNNAVVDLLFAFFSCIGIVSLFWNLIGLSYRRYAARHKIFTVVHLREGYEEDLHGAKRALWYADNFTSDHVVVVAQSAELSDELKHYCESLYVTKIADCELNEAVFR